MPRLPIFVLIADKMERARAEIARLDAYLENYVRAGFDDVWSRTATIAFTVHGVYTAMEDVMSDIANGIDFHVPRGGASHQALLDQMHVALDGRRPALLDDELFDQMVELKAFRHVVRHQYGVRLIPEKTEAKLKVMKASFSAFDAVLERLEATITREDEPR